jgi:hypothetical protein
VQARRLSPDDVARCDPALLVGAVLLGPVHLPAGTLRKGSRIDVRLAAELTAVAQAGQLRLPLRLACPGREDLHEDDAAERLAAAVAGEGIIPRPPRQSRLDLEAAWDGVLHIRTPQLLQLNSIDPLEIFTLFHGQAVPAGQVVASVKVAPHLIPAATVEQGVRVARESGTLIAVRPYVSREVAAVVVQQVPGSDRARFESSARLKIEALGSRFLGSVMIAGKGEDEATREIEATLQDLILDRRIPILLIGGVSAGDPLSPFYTALQQLGGKVLRHGVPAHPGSMIWLAELAQTQILGLPHCGMFSMATAADLILPRLLTGERLTAAQLAELAHGGLLTNDMRFRFPPYARVLPAPDEESASSGR